MTKTSNDRSRSLEAALRWARLVLAVVLVIALLGAADVTLAEDLQRGLRNYLDVIEGKKQLEDLTPQEQREVLNIHRRLQGGGSGSSSRPSYEIEVSHNDELFIINGEKYAAQTYCFGFNEGDQVIFLEGSPYGACATAEILNLRNKKTCKVWCE